MKLLKDKTVVITGGGRGIGKAVARAYANEGARLLLIARTEKELERTQKELQRTGARVEIMAGDVSGEQFVERIAAYIKKSFGSVDILVNAAGIYGPIGPVSSIDPKEWEKTLAINLVGTFLMSRMVIPLMRSSARGKIIHFGGGGEGALPNFSAYVASKGAVARFTETLAAEVKKLNIDVNAVLPGAVNTAFVDQLLAAGREKVGEEMYKKSLKQKKEGGVSPQKAAALCVFLASHRSDGISGKTFSAVWDEYEKIPDHLNEVMQSDVYTYRRIKPDSKK